MVELWGQTKIAENMLISMNTQNVYPLFEYSMQFHYHVLKKNAAVQKSENNEEDNQTAEIASEQYQIKQTSTLQFGDECRVMNSSSVSLLI